MRSNFSQQLSTLILTLPAPDGHDAFRTLVNPDDLEKEHPISDCSQALLQLQFTQLPLIALGEVVTANAANSEFQGTNPNWAEHVRKAKVLCPIHQL